MSQENGGGEHGVTDLQVKDTISISCAGFGTKLEIDLNCKTLDVALSLLERAHRELDARFRFARAQELLTEKIQNERLAGIAGDVMRGRQ